MDEGLRKLLYHLQRSGIGDPKILSAMARIPRELFIDDALKPQAYADEALPIECSQTISQPYIIAYMSERLNVGPDQDVLEIGTGSGYQTAILAQIARHVYTVERIRTLHEQALERLRQLGIKNFSAMRGDGSKGWPGVRRFERILVTAAATAVPEALIDQLSPCGAMVLPLGGTSDQRITLVTRTAAGRLAKQTLIPVEFVPLMPGIR